MFYFNIYIISSFLHSNNFVLFTNMFLFFRSFLLRLLSTSTHRNVVSLFSTFFFDVFLLNGILINLTQNTWLRMRIIVTIYVLSLSPPILYLSSKAWERLATGSPIAWCSAKREAFSLATIKNPWCPTTQTRGYIAIWWRHRQN